MDDEQRGQMNVAALAGILGAIILLGFVLIALAMLP